MFKYQRGIHAKDKITGFSGVITSRCDSLTGCNQYFLCPTELDKDNKIAEGHWIDEHALEVDTSKQQLKLDREPEQPPG